MKDINLSTDGNVVLTSRKELVRAQIKNIISTSCYVNGKGVYGERYGSPYYGSEIPFNLWEFLDTEGVSGAQNAIYLAVSKIPNIQVFYDDIDFALNELAQQVEITVYYKDLLTQEKDMVVVLQ